MRTLLLIAKLCASQPRALIPYLVLGPIVILFFGLGTAPGSAREWANFLAVGLLLGTFIAAIESVNHCREKKNRSLKPMERDIRELSDRHFNSVFAIVGAFLGGLFAFILDTPPVGYAIAATIVGLLGLSRRHVSRIFP